MNPNQSNPFYNTYVFTKQDLDRVKIKWWHYPILLFRPMYCQIIEGHMVLYKTTSDGRIFLLNIEKLEDITNV